MDIGKSITYVFEDKKWLEKVLIGGLIILGTILFSWTIIVPFVGFGLIAGYMLDVIRNVRRGDPQPLPEWNEWGDKIVKGLKLLLIYLIWSLPLILIYVPIGILAGLAGDSDSGGFWGTLILCFNCLAILWGIIIFLASPAFSIRLAETGEVSSGVKFGEILAFTRKNLGNIVIALLVLFAVNLVANFVGALLCGVGLLFTSFWYNLVQGHLFGQIGLKREGALVPTGGGSYDLSPSDVMPGVGELTDKMQTSATEAVQTAEDLGSSAVAATADTVDSTADVGRASSRYA